MKISMKQSGLVALALFALVTGGFAVQSVRAASVTLKAAVQPASPVEGISAQDKPEVNDLPDTVPDTTEVTDAKDSAAVTRVVNR